MNNDNFPHILTIEQLNELNPYDWISDLLVSEIESANIDGLLRDLANADTPVERGMAIFNIIVRCQELRPTD